MTISGAGVTIQDIDVRGNINDYYWTCNKAIELIDGAKDFTLRNVHIEAIDDGYGGRFSGSIYFSVADAGNSVVESVELGAWVYARSVTTGTVQFKDVTIDFVDNTYVFDGSTYSTGISGTDGLVSVEGLEIVVGDGIDLNTQILDKAREGTTIVLAEDIQVSEMIDITKGVILDLGGHTITASDTFTSTYENDSHLVNVSAGATVKNGTLKTTTGNKHVLNVWEASGVVLEDLVLDHTDCTKGAPLVVNASTVTIQGEMGFITGENSWYAVNIDPKESTASVTVRNGAELTFSGAKAIGILIDNADDGASAADVKLVFGNVKTTSDIEGFTLQYVNGVADVTIPETVEGENGETVTEIPAENATITVTEKEGETTSVTTVIDAGTDISTAITEATTKLEEVGVASTGMIVVIQSTGASSGGTVELDENAVDELNKVNASLTVTGSDGLSVQIPASTLSSTTGDVRVGVEQTSSGNIPSAVINALSSPVVIDVNLSDADGPIHDLGDDAFITIPVPAGMTGEIIVYHVDDAGNYERVDYTRSGDIIYVSTDQLSYFVLGTEPVVVDGGNDDSNLIWQYQQQQIEAQKKAEADKQSTYVAIAAGAVAALMILMVAGIRSGRL